MQTFLEYADARYLSLYPETYETAFRRLESPKTIFFDTRRHRLFPAYEGREAFVARCILLCMVYSEKRFGRPPRLSVDERRLAGRYCAPLR